jgi:murein DD-endopeptidase MepM/ murein hydrolase activator NlpD
MKYFVFFLLFSSLYACAQAPVIEELSIRPGEVKLIEFPLEYKDSQLFCRGGEVKLQKNEKKAQAIIVESYFSELKPFSCQLKLAERIVREFHFTVRVREYKAEQLKVDPKRIKLSPKDQKRADAEQLILNRIYASSPSTFLFKTSFVEPMSSVMTSVYGTKRVYNKQKKSQHLGIDYRAAIGEKVPAANSGKVVFSGDLFYTGWTVILDHGLDIFTVYGHLSKTLVKEGETVDRGQIIALSGNTGRTSGPHLHWGVKVQGQYIDGLVLVDETKRMFKN